MPVDQPATKNVIFADGTSAPVLGPLVTEIRFSSASLPGLLLRLLRILTSYGLALAPHALLFLGVPQQQSTFAA